MRLLQSPIQDIRREFVNEARALRDRNEFGRRHQPDPRTGPPQQRLRPHQLTGGDVDLGLVVHGQLIRRVQGAAQVPEQGQPSGVC